MAAALVFDVVRRVSYRPVSFRITCLCQMSSAGAWQGVQSVVNRVVGVSTSYLSMYFEVDSGTVF